MDDLTDAVAPIAVATRSGHVESVHHGVGVAIAPDGEVVASVGDPSTPVYPRSCLKPLQTSAMVSLGLDLPHHLLAVVIASHSGERGHTDAVNEILRRHGLDVTDLKNTPSFPLDPTADAEARRGGRRPTSLHQNCSGKHAGMLATCAVNAWSTEDYLAPDHPLQVGIVDHLAHLGASAVHIGVDGCGAPTHVLRLIDLARAVGTVAGPTSPTPAVAEAMRAHPWMVGGTDRDDTQWMRSIDGAIAKGGAAGVMVVALADGSAAAFKVADGSDAVRSAVTVQALRHLGADVDDHPDALSTAASPVLGHGVPVGSVEPMPWTSSDT